MFHGPRVHQTCTKYCRHHFTRPSLRASRSQLHLYHHFISQTLSVPLLSPFSPYFSSCYLISPNAFCAAMPWHNYQTNHLAGSPVPTLKNSGSRLPSLHLPLAQHQRPSQFQAMSSRTAGLLKSRVASSMLETVQVPKAANGPQTGHSL